jgi:hypothetical protein
MSKNSRVHTRPVTAQTIADHYDLPKQPIKEFPSPTPQAEGPTYIITHQSHPTLRAVTITYRGDIEQWIKDNPQLYITHITKL